MQVTDPTGPLSGRSRIVAQSDAWDGPGGRRSVSCRFGPPSSSGIFLNGWKWCIPSPLFFGNFYPNFYKLFAIKDINDLYISAGESSTYLYRGKYRRVFLFNCEILVKSFKRVQMMHSESISSQLNVGIFTFFGIKAPMLCCGSVADPEGPLPGRNEIGAKCRKGGCGRGIPPSAGGGPGASPEKIFEKWMQMVHSEPMFCRVRVDFPPENCVYM